MLDICTVIIEFQSHVFMELALVGLNCLTHCGLVILYADTYLGGIWKHI